MIAIFPTRPVQGFGNGNGMVQDNPPAVLQPLPMSTGFWDSILVGFWSQINPTNPIPTDSYLSPNLPTWLYLRIPVEERDAYQAQWDLLSDGEKQIVFETYPGDIVGVPMKTPQGPDLDAYLRALYANLQDSARDFSYAIQNKTLPVTVEQNANAILEHIKAALVLLRDIRHVPF